MKEQDYQSSFTANISPGEVFEKISRVNEWWGKNFEGESSRSGDVFTVRFLKGNIRNRVSTEEEACYEKMKR